MVLFAIFMLCAFTSAISTRTLDPLTVALARDLAVPTSAIALLASATALPYALMQPVLGPVGDQFGKDRVLKIALWATAGFLVISAFAPNYTSLLALRPLTGIAAAGVIPVAMAMIGDIYPPANRQIMIARFVTAAILGQLLGAVFAGVLEAAVGWRGIMLICAVVAFAAALTTTLVLKPVARPAVTHFSPSLALRTYGRILRNPRAWTCYGTGFICGGLTFGLLPHISPILEAQNNGSVREAGFVIAGLALGSMVFSFTVPVLLRLFARATLIAVGGIILASAFVLYALGAHWSIQIGLMGLVGLGFFMTHNSVQAEVSEIAPEARASAYAGHAFSFFLGQSIGPVVWGAELATVGIAMPFVINAAVILVTALAAYAMFSTLRLPSRN